MTLLGSKNPKNPKKSQKNQTNSEKYCLLFWTIFNAKNQTLTPKWGENDHFGVKTSKKSVKIQTTSEKYCDPDFSGKFLFCPNFAFFEYVISG